MGTFRQWILWIDPSRSAIGPKGRTEAQRMAMEQIRH